MTSSVDTKFVNHIKESDLTYRQWGELLDCEGSHVWRIAKGQVWPSRPIAIKIWVHSSGEIQMNDLVEPFLPVCADYIPEISSDIDLACQSA